MSSESGQAAPQGNQEGRRLSLVEFAEEKLPDQLRQEIRCRIECSLRRLGPDLDSQKVASFAEGLDRKLYELSPTFEAYADTDTLDDRLKALATGIGLQITRKRSASVTSRCFVEECKKLLRKRVGSKTYEEIFRLVDEIEKIRRTDSAWTASGET